MSSSQEPISTEAIASTATAEQIHGGHRKRLRERYRRSGLDDFAQHELIELLLTYCIPRVDVNEQAHALIDRFGSFSRVLDASPMELQDVPGIGPEAALFLSMIPGFTRRYCLDKCEPGMTFDTLAKLSDYLHALYQGIPYEKVYALMLDNSLRMIECCPIQDGSINQVGIDMRQIAEAALYSHASCVVLAHNHPRGLAIPSGNDREITSMVSEGLQLIGVQLLEHIIVTENSCAPLVRHQKGLLRTDPATGRVDEGFYRRFYDEVSEREGL